jgi:hypothetical protein
VQSGALNRKITISSIAPYFEEHTGEKICLVDGVQITEITPLSIDYPKNGDYVRIFNFHNKKAILLDNNTIQIVDDNFEPVSTVSITYPFTEGLCVGIVIQNDKVIYIRYVDGYQDTAYYSVGTINST